MFLKINDTSLKRKSWSAQMSLSPAVIKYILLFYYEKLPRVDHGSHNFILIICPLYQRLFAF